ncbi:unnamed protein product [Dracunculus medinensis]|uniref:ShKT domain-containing protein n=1 Tax=Dracunculus medinensis TaxID=318479 RepID=A0A0N4UQQ5_DRAME|nr:unnamed protein product [Dracunculus medinensis]
MLLYFCFFVFLVHGVKSGNDKAIENCNREVGGQQPTVDPSRCAHIDSPACTAIFPYHPAEKKIEKLNFSRWSDEKKIFPLFIADPSAGDHCDAFTLEMCRNAALNTIALMRCPMRCGLCDQAECPNTFDDAVCTALAPR